MIFFTEYPEHLRWEALRSERGVNSALLKERGKLFQGVPQRLSALRERLARQQRGGSRNGRIRPVRPASHDYDRRPHLRVGIKGGAAYGKANLRCVVILHQYREGTVVFLPRGGAESLGQFLLYQKHHDPGTSSRLNDSGYNSRCRRIRQVSRYEQRHGRGVQRCTRLEKIPLFNGNGVTVAFFQNRNESTVYFEETEGQPGVVKKVRQ